MILIFNFLYILQGFQIDYHNYEFINETNPYINNYLVDKSIINTTRIYKSSFIQKFFPLDLNISSKDISKIFKICVDFITEEDLYFINKIFDGKNSELININKNSISHIKNNRKNEKKHTKSFNEQLVIYNDKQENVINLDSKKKKKEIFFSKVDVIMKLAEIHIYILKKDFVKNLEINHLTIFFVYVKTLKPFSKFNSKIMFVPIKDKCVKMTLPEYILLGIWCFLKENNESPIGGNIQKFFRSRK